jgi:membrane protease YdiL (CAAX protease family)
MAPGRNIQLVIISIVFFISAFAIDLFNIEYKKISSAFVQYAVVYGWYILPAIVTYMLLFKAFDFWKSLGLDGNAIKAFIFAILATSPMLISSAIVGEITDKIGVLGIIERTVIAGFTEEFLFRAFLFGLLFRYLKMGFIVSAGLGALVFGAGHLYQGENLATSLGVFGITFLGALWFSWLYAEWNYNIWIPAFLHMLMNLSWILFYVSENALGGGLVNIFRILTIAITVIVTIRMCKKRGEYKVRPATFWPENTLKNT